MENQDLEQLTPQQERVLKLSFRPGLAEKHVRNIVLSAVAVAAALLAVVYWDVGLVSMALIAGTIVLISVVEKITYEREMIAYKSLVRKLVNRLEQLRGGEVTPVGASERLTRQQEPHFDQVKH